MLALGNVTFQHRWWSGKVLFFIDLHSVETHWVTAASYDPNPNKISSPWCGACNKLQQHCCKQLSWQRLREAFDSFINSVLLSFTHLLVHTCARTHKHTHTYLCTHLQMTFTPAKDWPMPWKKCWVFGLQLVCPPTKEISLISMALPWHIIAQAEEAQKRLVL